MTPMLHYDGRPPCWMKFSPLSYYGRFWCPWQ